MVQYVYVLYVDIYLFNYSFLHNELEFKVQIRLLLEISSFKVL